jgi:hypothetical protein
MIKRFAELLTQTVETQLSILQKKAGTYKEEFIVDKEIEELDKDTTPHTGIPAPVYLKDDPWFGFAPLPTENQRDYMEWETKIKQEEQEFKSEKTCESEDIHAKMYEIATQNWTTVEETQGGSENFQEGPSGWKSGIR